MVERSAKGIIKKGDYVLLDLKKRKNGNIWEFPGGHLEKGESPFETVVRELKEEVGVTVKDATLIGKRNSAFYSDVTSIEYFFLIKDFYGKPKALDIKEREILDVKWVRIQEIAEIPNLGWNVIDGIRFLSDIYPKYKKIYEELRRKFEARASKSFEYFFYSNSVSKWWNEGDLKPNEVFIEEERIIENIVRSLKPPVMEAGPGYGRITKILVNRFNKVYLLEANPDFIDLLSEKFKDKVKFVDGTMESINSNMKFNSILAFEVVVHTKLLGEFIGGVSRSLRKGGKFVSSLDNINSDWRRIRDRYKKIFGNKNPEYYREIPLETYLKLLDENGLKVEKIYEVGKNYHVSIPVFGKEITLPSFKKNKEPYLFLIIASKV